MLPLEMPTVATPKDEHLMIVDRIEGQDLSELCRMFGLKRGGSNEEKRDRLLSQGGLEVSRVLTLSSRILIGYAAEAFLAKDDLKVLLRMNALPVTGNRHDMYMRLVEHDKFAPKEVLMRVRIRGIKAIYSLVFEKPPMASESVLAGEILSWERRYSEWGSKPSDSVTLSSEPADTAATHYRLESVHPFSNAWPANDNDKREYDVAISYASEDRDTAAELAHSLRSKGIAVFYDEWDKPDLWGKNLSQHFRETYGKKTKFVLVLVSKHYAVKTWTDFEFTVARGEAVSRKVEFILPVRLDDTPMVGLHSSVAYLDMRKEGIQGVSDSLAAKLGKTDRAPSKWPLIPALMSRPR